MPPDVPRWDPLGLAAHRRRFFHALALTYAVGDLAYHLFTCDLARCWLARTHPLAERLTFIGICLIPFVYPTAIIALGRRDRRRWLSARIPAAHLVRRRARPRPAASPTHRCR